ncbi:regulator of cell autolysis [Flavobacterium sp. Sd200]|uniref:tetratricopeptide repeat-containing sensor histidine kinase n=1 Tax=Flavobacterium sp. Sd200 TaxID=2692211 RepID=UPI001369CE7B|nr:histidine kinase [Flavobacterium sp. Sd200]MXN90901.1 regulator of cell autolysis [Flavobacterium sp. Sd200]
MHRHSVLLLFLTIVLLHSGHAKAQDSLSQKKETPAEIKKATNNLERSLIENDNSKIAQNYELLAQELADKEELVKAQEYLFKALEIYTNAKDVAARARVMRNIAKTQEFNNKWRTASKNYKAAAETAINLTNKTLNLNDYNRLKSSGNATLQQKYLNANLLLLKKENKKSEIADAYIQLALLNLKKSDTINAIEAYRQAMPYAKNVPAKVNRIYSNIAKLQAAGKHYDDTVLTIKQLLSEAEKNKDLGIQIEQLRYIATIYFAQNEIEKATDALKESYKIASSSGKTFEAQESLLLLTDYYNSTGNDSISLGLYEEFTKNLDRIILSDHSLTDAKTFKVTEERIRRLESEKMFKDELITRKNSFNYFLLGAMMLLMLFFAFIIKALYSIKTKNKEIALQSLRREMNPHFLFNSLNSVNQFIAQNNELEANKYLTSYSNLMRNTMENSNKDFVTLANETENLTKYLELEHLRFKDKFDFKITVDENLDPDTVWVPNMIVQPHLENAIWHGLRYKETKGLLKMDIVAEGKKIIITIDDDGIGPTKSSELKTHNQRAHESRGLTNTKERMTLLNELYKTKMNFTMTEKQSPKTGTVVKIEFPLIYKP